MTKTRQNTPALWKDHLPVKAKDGNKYISGHILIYGAPELTGATRLAAIAAARMGSELVTVLCSKDTAPIYRTALPACILVRENLTWTDAKVTARIYGPGGLPIEPDFKTDLPTVLDADALQNLPKQLSPNYVLTPHEGEFKRAFPDITGTKIERAQKAAQQINAYIILKGAGTIIAAPDGAVVINQHSSPHLASAGTGDVLAGMIGGLLAQGMQPFEAACAAVWMHGDLGIKIGQRLIADDLITSLSGYKSINFK